MIEKIENLNYSLNINDVDFVQTVFKFYQQSNLKSIDEESMTKFSKVVEPYTASWVALMLAQGALQWIGGKIMGKIFGSSSELEIDLSAFVQATLLGVSRIIHQAISEEALRQAEVNLEALQIRFSHYNSAPSQDRLESATESSENVTADLKSFGMLGHHSYMIAVGIHLAILQERMKLINPNEKENIKDILCRGIKHCKEMNVEWKNWNNSRCYYKKGSGPFSIPKYRFYGPDGLIEMLVGPHTQQELDTRLSQHQQKTWSELKQIHVNPSEKIIKQWEAILSLPQLNDV